MAARRMLYALCLLAPLAWLMGVPWHDATEVGALLGVKTVLNEKAQAAAAK